MYFYNQQLILKSFGSPADLPESLLKRCLAVRMIFLIKLSKILKPKMFKTKRLVKILIFHKIAEFQRKVVFCEKKNLGHAEGSKRNCYQKSHFFDQYLINIS